MLATEANVLSGFRFSSAVFFSSKGKRVRERQREKGRERVSEGEKNLREQRAAIYGKTKGPRPVHSSKK